MSDAGDRLESWKEIAAYLKRDVRTVQRWERLDGLPVHRDAGQRVGRVFAYRTDLDAWRERARTTAALNGERRRPLRIIMASGAAALAFLIGGSYWLVRSREISNEPAVRRVWDGPEVGPLGTISPDGRFVSYVDPRTRDLAIRELHTASGRRVTTSGQPTSRELDDFGGSAFSRDSTQVAYVTSSDENTLQLRIERLDGSGNRVVFHDSKWKSMRPVGWTMGNEEILCLLGLVRLCQIAELPHEFASDHF